MGVCVEAVGSHFLMRSLFQGNLLTRLRLVNLYLLTVAMKFMKGKQSFKIPIIIIIIIITGTTNSCINMVSLQSSQCGLSGAAGVTGWGWGGVGPRHGLATAQHECICQKWRLLFFF